MLCFRTVIRGRRSLDHLVRGAILRTEIDAVLRTSFFYGQHGGGRPVAGRLAEAEKHTLTTNEGIPCQPKNDPNSE